MPRYRERTVTRFAKSVNTLPYKGDIMKVQMLEVVPIRTHKSESTIPADSSVIISENGDLIYRVESKFWSCLLSVKERKLVRALAATKNHKLCGNEAHKILGIPRKDGSERAIRDLVSAINRKLSERRIPIKLSFYDWYVRFLQT